MKQREIVILHEISVSVDLKHGATARDDKYAVHKTGKNFIRIPYNHPEAAKKYSFANGYGNLMSRVPVNELMLVHEPGYHDDSTDCVRRKIYCLDDDCVEAIHMIKDAVQMRIIEMKKEMDVLHQIWLTQSKISKT
jgi:hypothetical protein